MLHDFEPHAARLRAFHQRAGSDGRQRGRLRDEAPGVAVVGLHQHGHAVAVLKALIGGLLHLAPRAAGVVVGVAGVVAALHPALAEGVDAELCLLLVPGVGACAVLGVAEGHGVVVEAERHGQPALVLTVGEGDGLLAAAVGVDGTLAVTEGVGLVNLLQAAVGQTVEVIVCFARVLNAQRRRADDVVGALGDAVERLARVYSNGKTKCARRRLHLNVGLCGEGRQEQ